MSDLLLLALMILGAFRLWRLLALDGLPPLIWARERAEGALRASHGPLWAAGVGCPWCSGWHVSVLVWLAVWAAHPLPLPLLWPWAISAGVGILARLDEG